MPPAKKLKITALAGGVGASKLLLGLYEVMDPGMLTIIVNTGDDIVLHGLKISPDLDIVTYTLAGVVDPSKGWGIRGETFHALKRLAGYGRAVVGLGNVAEYLRKPRFFHADYFAQPSTPAGRDLLMAIGFVSIPSYQPDLWTYERPWNRVPPNMPALNVSARSFADARH